VATTPADLDEGMSRVAQTTNRTWQMASIANQRLWVSSKPGTSPAGEGPVLAVRGDEGTTEYLVCDTTPEASENLVWVSAQNVASASIRAPRATTSLANQRLWMKSTRGTNPPAEGPVLAVASDEHTTEYLVCDTSEDGGDKLVWVDAENVDRAWIKKPPASKLPTPKVTAAGASGVAGGAASVGIIAALESWGVDLGPEAAAAISTLATAFSAFAGGYLRRDPNALGTPAAASASDASAAGQPAAASPH
jgi:hypothetical protein